MTFRRLVAILAATLLVSYLVAFTRGCIPAFYAMEDTSYRPKDIERQYYETVKMRDALEKGSDGPPGK